MDLVCQKRNNENIVDIKFRFFHYTWFIDSESLCFILILKEKMTIF